MVNSDKNPKTKQSLKDREAPSSKAEKVVETDTTQVAKPKYTWSVDSLFWGLLLVVIGGILLLDNLGIVAADWNNLWRLWPLAIIAGGFSLLSPKHWLWRFLSGLFIAASIAAVLLLGTGAYMPTGDNDADVNRQIVQQEVGVKRGEIIFNAGASKLNIRTLERNSLVDASLTGEGLDLQHKSKVNGSTQNISLSADRQPSVWLIPKQSTWDVALTDRLPLDVTIDAGASSIDADFSAGMLESLTLDSGASWLYLTLGDKMPRQKVTIDSGASSVTIRVPSGSGVRLTLDSGLTKKDLADLKESEKGVYVSDNYTDAQNQIDIEADLGASSIKIVRL